MTRNHGTTEKISPGIAPLAVSPVRDHDGDHGADREPGDEQAGDPARAASRR